MSDKEILKKAIDKALDNDWTFSQRGFDYWMDSQSDSLDEYIIKEKLYFPIIFSHEFVKAFWNCEHKPEEYNTGCYMERCIKCGEFRFIGNEWNDWKYHLKRMVLCEEPLKYLENFL